MIQIKEIRLKDFMSFKDDVFIIAPGKPIALQGENLTDKGQKSNGSGKSALQEAIYRLFVGTSIRKGIRDKDLIRKGEKQAEISCILHDTSNNDIWNINRTIKLKSSEVVSVVKNENDLADMFATVRDANKFILSDILNTTKEDIDAVYIVNSEKYSSFFFSSDRDKKELIARFSGADILTGVEDFVKADVKSLESEIKQHETQKMFLGGKIAAVQDQIDDFSIESLQKEKEKRIDAVKEQISRVIEPLNDKLKLDVKSSYKSIGQKQIEKGKLNDKAKEFENQLKNINTDFDTSKLDEILKDIKETNEVSSDAEIKKEEFRDLLNDTLNKTFDLRNKTRGEIECPECNHVFVPGKNINVAKAKETIAQYEAMSKEIEAEIKDFNSVLKETNEILDVLKSEKLEIQREYDKIQENVDSIKADIRRIKNQSGQFDIDIQNLNDSINRSHERIDENDKERKRLLDKINHIKDEKLDDPTVKLKKQIKSLTNDIKLEDKEIQKVQDIVFETKQWEHNFKQFFTFLTNASLMTIEQETNKYLQKMRSDLSIQIEGVKIMADGSLKENITPTIIRNGFVEGSFGKLSGGERVRVDAANLIARQSIINETHKKGGIDLIFIDEVFDKVDSEGMDNLLSSFEGLNKTIILTTHIAANINHETVKVVKENGISKIYKN